ERAGRGLAIYLRLAFEAARRWHSFTELDERTQPADDVAGIIGQLFERLSDDGAHGPVLVERSLALLAAARNGLAEDELLALLSPLDPPPEAKLQALSADEWWALIRRSDDWAVLADYHRRSPRSPRVGRLPVVLWSRLWLDLQPYLTERAADGAALLGFYHR